MTAQLYDISDLQFTGNSLPLCAGTYEAPQPASTCSSPDEYVMDIIVVTGGSIACNDFAGALGVVQPQRYDQDITGVTECGNSYGVGASQADEGCTAARQPPGSGWSPRGHGRHLDHRQRKR